MASKKQLAQNYAKTVREWPFLHLIWHKKELGLSGFAGGNVKVYKMREGSLHPIHLNNMPVMPLSAGQLILA